MKVALTGASGLIGRALASVLEKRGDQVIVLRRPTEWDPENGTIDRDLLEREAPDAVVHLSGENLAARRWNAAHKAKIRDSRIKSTDLIARTVASLTKKPSVLVSASAIGIYGDRGDELLTDEAAPGTGFLAETCKEWEAAAAPARQAKIRVVHPRFGVVLSKDGGALPRMLMPFKLGLGGRLGSGAQWVGWVAREDATGAILYMLEREAFDGAVNVVSPHPVRNRELTKILATALHRPAFLPVPGFALELALGEMAKELLLASQCVTPERLLATSFPFRFKDLGTFCQTLAM
jgi:uncharacterized protein (TIGR01777 family)